MLNLRRCPWFLTGFLVAALAVGAQSQQPPPKPEEKPKPAKKAKKVWTEEDLSGLRRPSDEYAEKKAAEADAAAAAAAKQAERKPGEAPAPEEPRIDPVSGKPIYDPDSPEGMQEQLTNWEGSLVRLQEALREARARLADTQDPSRWETARTEVDLLEQNIVETQRRIGELKAKLAANPPTEKPAATQEQAPPAPPPPPQ